MNYKVSNCFSWFKGSRLKKSGLSFGVHVTLNVSIHFDNKIYTFSKLRYTFCNIYTVNVSFLRQG